MPTEERASAEIMPDVTVWPMPKGLPMARTRSPTSSAFGSPSARKGSGAFEPSTRSTARSVRGSRSTISASYSRRSVSAMRTSSAPSMTWLLVTTMPSAETMTPEPSALCIRSGGMSGRPPNSGPPSPKKRRKNGSFIIGERVRRCTSRLAYTLTTAGAASRATGAKERRTSFMSCGAARTSASSAPIGAGSAAPRSTGTGAAGTSAAGGTRTMRESSRSVRPSSERSTWTGPRSTSAPIPPEAKTTTAARRARTTSPIRMRDLSGYEEGGSALGGPPSIRWRCRMAS